MNRPGHRPDADGWQPDASSARIQILAPGSSSLKPPRWSSAPSRAALITTHCRTASAESTAHPKEKAPAIVALAGAKSQMQALHSERRYFRRVASRELIDVSVINNNNVNGVAKCHNLPGTDACRRTLQVRIGLRHSPGPMALVLRPRLSHGRGLFLCRRSADRRLLSPLLRRRA